MNRFNKTIFIKKIILICESFIEIFNSDIFIPKLGSRTIFVFLELWARTRTRLINLKKRKEVNSAVCSKEEVKTFLLVSYGQEDLWKLRRVSKFQWHLDNGHLIVVCNLVNLANFYFDILCLQLDFTLYLPTSKNVCIF